MPIASEFSRRGWFVDQTVAQTETVFGLWSFDQPNPVLEIVETESTFSVPIAPIQLNGHFGLEIPSTIADFDQ